MAEHVIFRDCSNGIKKDIGEYWDRKRARLERLLVHFPDDQRHLHLTVQRQDLGYSAHAVLRLPTGTLVAEAPAQEHRAALDIVADRLAEEIRRHKDTISTTA